MTTDLGVFFLSKAQQQKATTNSFTGEPLRSGIASIHQDRQGRKFFGGQDGRLYVSTGQKSAKEIEISLNGLPLTKAILGIVDNPLHEGIIIAGNFGVVLITEIDISKGKSTKKLIEEHWNEILLDEVEYALAVGVKAMHLGKSKEILLGSVDGYSIFSKTSALCKVSHEEKTERVYAVWSHDSGKKYLGRKSGLYEIYGDSERHLLTGMPVSSLLGGENDLWIGTEGNGLYYLRDGNLTHIPKTEGKTIKTQAYDIKGDIWMIADQELLKVSGSPFSSDSIKVSFSTTAAGLSLNSVEQIQIYEDTLYLVGSEGVSILSTKDFNWEKDHRELFFSDITINGQTVTERDDLTLAYNQNNIEISYVSLEFNQPDKVNYEYKMEGLDTFWRSSNSLKQEFWSLAPGNYTFSVRAGLNSQNISETKSINFHIATPWWQKTSFWIITGLGFILTVTGIATYRSRLLIRREKEKAKLEEQITEMRLQALQSQMNPHFIFNSLQAIQDYIFDKNEEQANLYLVKFSRLMRLILESSRKKTIVLSEELRLIELYVSLEQLRFSESFDYSCHLSNNINPEELYIPSMLVQPFIENAVNHGIFRKKNGRGKVDLKLIKTGHILIRLWTKSRPKKIGKTVA